MSPGRTLAIAGAPIRALVAVAATAALGLACAPAALADSSTSANWAGYAIHGRGDTFKEVIGTWTQPEGDCTPGEQTYSSDWVGIGGYSTSSDALEQIGTEFDCTASGHARSSAWYELVPAASVTTKLRIDPGDRVRATVSVSGHEVDLTIDDLTRGRSLRKRIRAPEIDTTSAEWIVEAPSVCRATNACETLPLADFASTTFTSARAVLSSGYAGAIADRHWTTTKITLAEGGRRFVTSAGVASRVGATPTALTAAGNGFTVTYDASSTTSGGSGSTSPTGSPPTGGTPGSGGVGGTPSGSLRLGAVRIAPWLSRSS